jgi:hypothetical protein
MAEMIIAITAVLALIVSGAALFVSLKISREDLTARLEQFQFSWTPLVAVQGGNLEDQKDGTRSVDCTVHVEGRGFVHNLILTIFLDDESAERAKIVVWEFKRAPAIGQETFIYQDRQPSQTNQLARIEGTFQNVFRQQIRFTQRGVVRVPPASELALTSGAPHYVWPWKTIKPA